MTAYACLQDWDAICPFVYMGGGGSLYPQVKLKLYAGAYSFSDPAEMGLSPLCALKMFVMSNWADQSPLVPR